MESGGAAPAAVRGVKAPQVRRGEYLVLFPLVWRWPFLGGGSAHGQPVSVQLAAFRPAHPGVPGPQRRHGAGEPFHADLLNIKQLG